MTSELNIPTNILAQIHADGERSYPEEGAGLMLGKDENGRREVQAILPLTNSREDSARHNRYLITAEDMMAGEMEAMRMGLDIVGIFHSHPDHPNRPSEFDREWALPWFSYVITSIQQGKAAGSRSWRLEDNRQSFIEETIVVLETEQK
ncbi:MAG: M67 family metallopeptidase [Anaerolineales bacterium]|jgi:proteasome lid subunit RPN8/RPN11